jgi:hypothetical protein
MSIAEMINQGTERQSQSWSILAKNLGDLGREVGNQLALQQYQKQAAEALPAMQAAYRSAMDDVSRGSVSEGYKKFMDAQFQFGGSQNPLISGPAQLFGKGFTDYATIYEKQQQRQAQYGGGGGVASGGGADGGYYDVESALGLPTSEDIQTPTGDVPISEGTELNAEYVDEQPAQNYTANLLTLANSATPKFKDFLKSVAKNPPPPERVQQATQYNQEYEATPEYQKAAYRQGVSIVVPSRKEIGEIKNKYGEFFFEFDSDQKKIVGDGIEGVVLSPAQVIKSVTEGSKGLSRTSGTNLEDLMTYKKGIDGSLEQLGDEKLKKFLAKNGGIFNVGFKQEGKKKIVNADGNEEEVPSKITLFPKSIDPEKLSPETRGKYEIEITPPQLAAFQYIKGMPGEMNRLRAQKSDSSLVKVGAQGPTAEAAKGLPAMTAEQPTKRKVEVLTDKSGRYYLNAKGQKVYIK